MGVHEFISPLKKGQESGVHKGYNPGLCYVGVRTCWTQWGRCFWVSTLEIASAVHFTAWSILCFVGETKTWCSLPKHLFAIRIWKLQPKPWDWKSGKQKWETFGGFSVISFKFYFLHSHLFPPPSHSATEYRVYYMISSTLHASLFWLQQICVLDQVRLTSPRPVDKLCWSPLSFPRLPSLVFYPLHHLAV